MFDFLIHLIPTLLILGTLIAIHEFGHFIACRLSKVKVEKFSIGFGPEVFSWQGSETRYSLSLIPFGGYVKPQGESNDEIAARGGKLSPGDFLAAPKLNRFFILVGGVAMNFIFAYVLFVIVMVVGRPIPKATIGSFVKGLPAETSGLHEGDEVTHLNSEEVLGWQDLTMKILKSDGQLLIFTVSRGNEIFDVEIQPQVESGRDLFGQSAQVPRVGITPGKGFNVEQYSIGSAFIEAAQLEFSLIRLTLEALWRLVLGQLSPKALVGPLGIVSMTGNAAQMGLMTLLQFAALLSVSLGVINLLPIPALDGGHIFFLGLEVIFQRPVSPKIQDRVTQMGFAFLMVLMVLVVYNDLSNMGALNKIKSFFG
jgi:regulator of sigma E protease